EDDGEFGPVGGGLIRRMIFSQGRFVLGGLLPPLPGPLPQGERGLFGVAADCEAGFFAPQAGAFGGNSVLRDGFPSPHPSPLPSGERGNWGGPRLGGERGLFGAVAFRERARSYRSGRSGYGLGREHICE